MKHRLYLFLALLFCLLVPGRLMAAHGISLDGKLKYQPGFTRFAYTSDQAVKGGQLVLHDLGSFDKMNPYTLKGNAPAGLEELVFESLTVPSLDETFAAYGLIASDIELAVDRLSVVYTIDKQARFADNTPITAADVEFSLNTLKSDKAHPFYQAYYQDISKAEIIDTHKIRFHFAKRNRELHMIASQIPIFSKKFYEANPFDGEKLIPPLGSGPYVVSDVNPGKSITYKRNQNYWAKDHPARRGYYNFDTITYKYFKDQIVAVEAFKAQDFDFMYVNIAKQWARDLQGDKFDKQILVKKMLPHKNNAGLQGFVMNTRKPLFADRRVRQALGLAFDFEWTNTTLFFGQYTPCNSYFSNSVYAAEGLPEGRELELLKPFQEQLPAEVFTKPLTSGSTAKPHSLRDNLRQATKLLAEAGWSVQDGRLKNAKGEPFEFEILIYEPSFGRVMSPYVNNLQKLGINASYRQIDIALYTRRMQTFEFDMLVNVYGQSQSPGNEQRNYWHSSAAQQEGSRNLAGIKDPVVDDLVEKIVYAETQEDLRAACQALDRALWYGYYVVPNWYVAGHRVTYRNIFSQPEILPLYYSPFQALMTWWLKAETPTAR